MADIDLVKYLQSSLEGILLTIVGIILLAHAFGSPSTPPIFFFLVFGFIGFNIVCQAMERRFKKLTECPFFPSIVVNVLLITALMYVVADFSPRLGLNLSLAFLFLSLSAATSLKPKQTLLLSALVLLLLGFFLFKTNTFLPNLSYLLLFTLLLLALTLFSTLNATRFSKESLKARVLDSGLTEREKQIMVLLAEGRANKEIAGALGISEKTIRNQLSLVYRKLNVASRQEAILRFL